MTASTLNSAQAAFSVPGVYELPRRRSDPPLPVRTDVAGFVGFEPRVRDGTTPSRLVGTTPFGHIFRVDVATFNVRIRGKSIWVPGRRDIVISSDPATTLIANGEGTIFAIVVATRFGDSHLLAIRSPATPGVPPNEDEVRAAVLARLAAVYGEERHRDGDGAEHDWLRIADVQFERDGGQLWTTVHPALKVTRCDEWRDYERAFGGLVDYELHVRTASLPSTPHLLHVEVDTFQTEIGGRPVRVPGGRNLVVASDPLASLFDPGNTLVFAVMVAVGPDGPRLLFVPSRGAETRAPTDAEVANAAGSDDWLRLANVCYEKTPDGIDTTVFPVVRGRQCPAYQESAPTVGNTQEDGTYLASAVRAFFANGGRRCYVSTIRRPILIETNKIGLEAARQDMIGYAGASLEQATGLERLLLIDDVGIVDVPDLHARRVSVSGESFPLPPSERDVCFSACPPAAAPAQELAARSTEPSEPLYSNDQIYGSQRALVLRCMSLRWRVLALLAPPLSMGASGLHEPPGVEAADAWCRRFLADPTLTSGDDSEAYRSSCAAMYFPWVLAQEGLDAPLRVLPPTPFAAGVMARRDLARGPHVAPANEPLVSVIALCPHVTDEELGRLYEPPIDGHGFEVPGINCFRATPGRGVLVWGARTLSIDKWLRYIPVRRCLSAIERRCKVGLDTMVFEPNSPATWALTTQLVVNVLQAVFEAGGLRGATPAESYYVRCDETVNPPASVQQGLLVCEVGVAIAAPAEFVVFRLGRQEGVTEITE